MKNIIFVRHAKSSWKDLSLADEDRPLNGRGKQDAPVMGMRLKERDIHPEILLSSTAKRARSTAKKIAKGIGFPKSSIQLESGLYHAGTSEILRIVHRLPNDSHQVMLFGHNPGFTGCVNDLSGSSIYNIPTCGIASINFDVENWDEVRPNGGVLLFFDYPKKL
jgi:phosphohistidine phosphatase